LLGLQALRTTEIMRASVGDLQRRGDACALLVHGKTHARLVFVRPDVANALARLSSCPGAACSGTSTASRCYPQWATVRVANGSAAAVKRPRVSNHALRHSGATLAYHYTHDLRAVQDMLGHQDPKTTARYARVVDRARTNPALKVPADL